MRTLVHLSDLHFGRIDAALIGPLTQLIHDLKPDLTIVSGDLTQRARVRQFQEARRFLAALPSPQIVVPGNHDIPLYNVFLRFLSPLGNYRRYITNDLSPRFADDEIAVFGINTARSLTIKGGRINETQAAWLREQLCRIGPEISKIIVTHHPVDLPANHHEHNLVGRARMLVEALADCGADIFLAGHLHLSHIGQTATRYRVGRSSSLVVQAGTATSTRSRGESNSFNVIRIASPDVSIERFVWQPTQAVFVSSGTEHFCRGADGWVRPQQK